MTGGIINLGDETLKKLQGFLNNEDQAGDPFTPNVVSENL
jgi:hypothetical protein